MSKMYVKAVKFSKGDIDTKVLYEKDGALYMRTSRDGFSKGLIVHNDIKQLCYSGGFLKVEGSSPYFSSGTEIKENIRKFERTGGGKVKYKD